MPRLPTPPRQRGRFVTTDAPTPPCRPSSSRIHGLGLSSLVVLDIPWVGCMCSDGDPPSGREVFVPEKPLRGALAPSLAVLVFLGLRSFASPGGAPVGSMQRADFSDERLLPAGTLLHFLCVF